MSDINGCYGRMADSVVCRLLGLWLLRNIDQSTNIRAQ